MFSNVIFLYVAFTMSKGSSEKETGLLVFVMILKNATSPRLEMKMKTVEGWRHYGLGFARKVSQANLAYGYHDLLSQDMR